MIGWVSAKVADRGPSSPATVIHADPSCSLLELVPVQVSGCTFWAHGSHKKVTLTWCPRCQQPEAPGEWADRAACKGADQGVFFTDDENARYREARRICNGCEVLVDCRGYALRTRQSAGVWGGLAPWERKALIRASMD